MKQRKTTKPRPKTLLERDMYSFERIVEALERLSPPSKTLLERDMYIFERIVEALERLSPPPSTARRIRVRSYLGGHRWNR